MKRERLLDELNTNLAIEYGNLIQYVHYAHPTFTGNRPDVRKVFRRLMADEMRHARWLCEMIDSLGAVPSPEITDIAKPNLTRSVDVLINIHVLEEKRAVDKYEWLINQTDIKEIREKIGRLLEDERRHVRMLEELLGVKE